MQLDTDDIALLIGHQQLELLSLRKEVARLTPREQAPIDLAARRRPPPPTEEPAG